MLFLASSPFHSTHWKEIMPKLKRNRWLQLLVFINLFTSIVTSLNRSFTFPTMLMQDLQRLSIILSAYNYEFIYKEGENLANLTACSRLPLKINSNIEEIFSFSIEAKFPKSVEQILVDTKNHSSLVKAPEYSRLGWPHFIKEDALKTYYNRRN